MRLLQHRPQRQRTLCSLCLEAQSEQHWLATLATTTSGHNVSSCSNIQLSNILTHPRVVFALLIINKAGGLVSATKGYKPNVVSSTQC
jgi:hypothetical protein